MYRVAVFTVVGSRLVSIEISISDMILSVTVSMRDRGRRGNMAIDGFGSLTNQKLGVLGHRILQKLCPEPAKKAFG